MSSNDKIEEAARIRSANGSLKKQQLPKEQENKTANHLTMKNGGDVNHVINDKTLNRFIEIQSEIENYESAGVFDGLRLVEEDFERLEKSKRQAEINHKVLAEQTEKEKQDFENISQPTVQSFFKNKQAHNMAISKEQVFLIFHSILK